MRFFSFVYMLSYPWAEQSIMSHRLTPAGGDTGAELRA